MKKITVLVNIVRVLTEGVTLETSVLYKNLTQ